MRARTTIAGVLSLLRSWRCCAIDPTAYAVGFILRRFAAWILIGFFGESAWGGWWAGQTGLGRAGDGASPVSTLFSQGQQQRSPAAGIVHADLDLRQAGD